jgi:photosystem I subunit IX
MKSQYHLDNIENLHILIFYLLTNQIKSFMEDLQKYLSTAPVLLTLWLSFTAGFIIEINRFFPDMLGLYF